MVSLFDSHTHLESFHRQGILDETLRNARAAGLVGMVTVGTDPGDWPLYRELAQKESGWIFYSAGLHPCHVKSSWEEDLSGLEDYFAGDHRPVALGETGLDRFHLPKDPGRAEELWGWQKAAFRQQLRLAKALDCPVIIHSRGAFAECLELLQESGVSPGRVVFHCFAEGPAEMEALRNWGGRASFTGIITYKSAQSVREAAAKQGWDRLLLETDAPYLAPVPQRGKPNQPAWVKHIAEFLAAYTEQPLESLARTSVEEARAFFQLEE